MQIFANGVHGALREDIQSTENTIVSNEYHMSSRPIVVDLIDIAVFPMEITSIRRSFLCVLEA